VKQPPPSTADADDLDAFVLRPVHNRLDTRVQSRDIAAPG